MHVMHALTQTSTSVPSILMDALTTVPTLLDRILVAVEVAIDWLLMDALVKVFAATITEYLLYACAQCGFIGNRPKLDFLHVLLTKHDIFSCFLYTYLIEDRADILPLRSDFLHL